MRILGSTDVSTHSRAEAAADVIFKRTGGKRGFNTQPRGGGCPSDFLLVQLTQEVSTHSRAEAAAQIMYYRAYLKNVSTHSRAEAAAD